MEFTDSQIQTILFALGVTEDALDGAIDKEGPQVELTKRLEEVGALYEHIAAHLAPMP